MTQKERREFLIQYLLEENPKYENIEIPQSDDEQKYLFRSLVNVRPPLPASEDFLTVQNEYLAVRIVREWKENTGDKMKIVFNVFSEKDEAIYEATEKGLQFLRPEKKSQIFEKKIS